MKKNKNFLKKSKSVIEILESEDFNKLRAVDKYRGIPDRAIARALKEGGSLESATLALDERVANQKKIREEMKKKI